MVRCSFPVVVSFLISSLVGIATASTFEVNDSPKMPLSENWFIQPSADVPADGAAISVVGFSTRGWYPATLPSTVLSALVEDLIQVTYLKLWEDGCRLLRDFAMQHPEAILGYIKKTAANATHDHFKHGHSQSSGGDKPHVSTSDVDPEAGNEVHGSQEKIAREVLLNEIGEHLKRSLTGPDQERDRMIFWLYFRQGMSTKEIANLPGINLSMKGVGSVIERLKHAIREQIVGTNSDAEEGTEQNQEAISAQISY